MYIANFAMLLNSFVRLCIQTREQFIKNTIRNRLFCKHSAEGISSYDLATRIKESFKQKNINVTDGHACIIANCPMCPHEKNEPKLYINKTTGLFICDRCCCTGSANELENILSLKAKADTTNLRMLKEALKYQEGFHNEWEYMKKNCRDISTLSPEEYAGILRSLSLPNVSQNDLSTLNCIYEPISNALHLPLRALGNRIVGFKSLSIDIENTVPTTETSGCIIYRQETVENDETAILVGSIRDVLALISQKVENVIVCLPYDLRNLPQEVLPRLENFKNIILWFGHEEPNWYTVGNFAKKLGESRCYFVRPTELQPRPRLAVEKGYNVKKILSNVKPIKHQSITTFEHLKEDILSELQNIDKVQGVKWKRYPSLNGILKGHRRGEFTVLTGPTGCGKTTFMSEYSLDLAMQGINTLWGSFEIRNVRLAKTMLQQMAGVELDCNLDKFNTYAEEFAKLPLYFMTFHGQQDIRVVMEAIEHATYVYDIAHVIIDNIQFMMGMSNSTHMDRFYKQDTVISQFRSFATKHNCHVSLIIHPRKENENDDLTTTSIFGSAKSSQEADNVLIIQNKRLDSVRGKKYLQVAKNRFSGDLGIVKLEFDKASLSFAQNTKRKEETEVSRSDRTRVGYRKMKQSTEA